VCARVDEGEREKGNDSYGHARFGRKRGSRERGKGRPRREGELTMEKSRKEMRKRRSVVRTMLVPRRGLLNKGGGIEKNASNDQMGRTPGEIGKSIPRKREPPSKN